MALPAARLPQLRLALRSSRAFSSGAAHSKFTQHLDSATPLGKSSEYVDQYDPAQLAPVPRKQDSSMWRRSPVFFPEPVEEGVTGTRSGVPVSNWGFDRWTGYELSWLGEKGKPTVSAATFDFPHSAASIIESKSFKLYLNSLNQTRFPGGHAEVAEVLRKDLSAACGAPVAVQLHSLDALHQIRCFSPSLHEPEPLPGFGAAPVCLDALDVPVEAYDLDPALLRALPPAESSEPEPVVSETLFSHLLKSNCPVTGQPDWASVVLQYTVRRPAARAGEPLVQLPRLDPAALLRYLVSYRRHADFHEHCLESIAGDVYQCLLAALLRAPGAAALPEERLPRLAVQACARYTRRGGLDINPVRQLASFPLPQEFVQVLDGAPAVPLADCAPLGLGLGPVFVGHLSRQ